MPKEWADWAKQERPDLDLRSVGEQFKDYWSAKLVAEYVYDNFANLPNLINREREEAVKFLKMIPWNQRDKAGARGTEIHAIAETIIHGGEAEVAGEFAEYVNGYVEWLDQWEVIPVLTEKVVANRVHGYAGTFDAILRFGNGPLAGKTYLCDWKTSTGVYGEMAMQIAAYANADFYLDEEGNEQSLPVLDRIVTIIWHGEVRIASRSCFSKQ